MARSRRGEQKRALGVGAATPLRGGDRGRRGGAKETEGRGARAEAPGQWSAPVEAERVP